MKNFVDVKWLHDHMDKVVILDVRKDYLEKHIPGAISLELEAKLTGPIEEHGGRHPMPKTAVFEKILQDAGLSLEDDIICYDDGALAFAGRLWWMLKYNGFKRVRVLEGGLNAWQAAGFETTREVPVIKANPDLKLEVQEDMAYTMEEVRDKIIPNKDIALVDSRAAARYRGETEPLDHKAGHIPSALNYPYDTLLAAGEIPEQKIIKDWYKDLFDYPEVVVYCGSGITATVNALLMEEVGLEPKLYPGSFSDWISYPENQINTKEI